MWRWLRTSEGHCTIWALAVIVSFFCLAFYIEPPWRPQPTPSQEQKNRTITSPDQKANTRTDKQKSPDVFWQTANNDPLAYFTVWLAAGTFLLVAVAASQAGLFLWQLSLMREGINDAKIAADAAKQAAEAGKDHADIARTSMISAQRAYISVRSIGMSPVPREGSIETITFTVILQNTGSTPTKSMLTHSSMRIFDDSIPSDFDFPDIDARQPSPIFIGASGMFNWIGTFVFSLNYDDLISVMARKRRPLIWGWADYNDVFPNTIRHRTEFCFEIMVFGDPAFSDIKEVVSVSQYRKHNAVDDECYRQPRSYGL